METPEDKQGLEWLRKKLSQFDMQISEQTVQLEKTKAQREAIYQTIQNLFGKPNNKSERVFESAKASKKENVISATIELIVKEKRSVTSAEIMKYLENKKLDLSTSKSKKHAVLSAILNYEVNRKNTRLVRVQRGVYNLKK